MRSIYEGMSEYEIIEMMADEALANGDLIRYEELTHRLDTNEVYED